MLQQFIYKYRSLMPCLKMPFIKVLCTQMCITTIKDTMFFRKLSFLSFLYNAMVDNPGSTYTFSSCLMFSPKTNPISPLVCLLKNNYESPKYEIDYLTKFMKTFEFLLSLTFYIIATHYMIERLFWV